MPPKGDSPAGDGVLDLPTSGSADDAVVSGEDGAGNTTIADLAKADDQFSTLLTAIAKVDDGCEGAACLGTALSDAGATLTVFGPITTPSMQRWTIWECR